MYCCRDTCFTKQLHTKDTIKIGQHSLLVEEVISETVLRVKEGHESITEPQPFTCLPHVDHSSTFNAVYDKLATGAAVAIFPEGGSHDQSHLLPLKAGISVMALGAMSR